MNENSGKIQKYQDDQPQKLVSWLFRGLKRRGRGVRWRKEQIVWQLNGSQSTIYSLTRDDFEEQFQDAEVSLEYQFPSKVSEVSERMIFSVKLRHNGRQSIYLFKATNIFDLACWLQFGNKYFKASSLENLFSYGLPSSSRVECNRAAKALSQFYDEHTRPPLIHPLVGFETQRASQGQLSGGDKDDHMFLPPLGPASSPLFTPGAMPKRCDSRRTCENPIEYRIIRYEDLLNHPERSNDNGSNLLMKRTSLTSQSSATPRSTVIQSSSTNGNYIPTQEKYILVDELPIHIKVGHGNERFIQYVVDAAGKPGLPGAPGRQGEPGGKGMDACDSNEYTLREDGYPGGHGQQGTDGLPGARGGTGATLDVGLRLLNPKDSNAFGNLVSNNQATAAVFVNGVCCFMVSIDLEWKPGDHEITSPPVILFVAGGRGGDGGVGGDGGAGGEGGRGTSIYGNGRNSSGTQQILPLSCMHAFDREQDTTFSLVTTAALGLLRGSNHSSDFQQYSRGQRTGIFREPRVPHNFLASSMLSFTTDDFEHRKTNHKHVKVKNPISQCFLYAGDGGAGGRGGCGGCGGDAGAGGDGGCLTITVDDARLLMLIQYDISGGQPGSPAEGGAGGPGGLGGRPGEVWDELSDCESKYTTGIDAELHSSRTTCSTQPPNCAVVDATCHTSFGDHNITSLHDAQLDKCAVEEIYENSDYLGSLTSSEMRLNRDERFSSSCPLESEEEELYSPAVNERRRTNTREVISGAWGANGQPGLAGKPGSSGLRGESGSVTFRVLTGENEPQNNPSALLSNQVPSDNHPPSLQSRTYSIYSDRYGLWVLDFDVIGLDGDGVLKPNEEISITNIRLINRSAMPLPSGACLSFASSQTILMVPNQSAQLGAMAPNEQITVKDVFTGRVHLPSGPQMPGVFEAESSVRACVSLCGIQFMQGCFEKKFLIRYPLKLGTLSLPKTVYGTEEFKISFKIQNLSKKTFCGPCIKNCDEDNRVAVSIRHGPGLQIFQSNPLLASCIKSDFRDTQLSGRSNRASSQLPNQGPTVLEFGLIPAASSTASGTSSGELELSMNCQVKQNVGVFAKLPFQIDLYLAGELIQYEQGFIRCVRRASKTQSGKLPMVFSYLQSPLTSLLRSHSICQTDESTTFSPVLFITDAKIMEKEFSVWQSLLSAVGLGDFQIWDVDDSTDSLEFTLNPRDQLVIWPRYNPRKLNLHNILRRCFTGTTTASASSQMDERNEFALLVTIDIFGELKQPPSDAGYSSLVVQMLDELSQFQSTISSSQKSSNQSSSIRLPEVSAENACSMRTPIRFFVSQTYGEYGLPFVDWFGGNQCRTTAEFETSGGNNPGGYILELPNEVSILSPWSQMFLVLLSLLSTRNRSSLLEKQPSNPVFCLPWGEKLSVSKLAALSIRPYLQADFHWQSEYHGSKTLRFELLCTDICESVEQYIDQLPICLAILMDYQRQFEHHGDRELRSRVKCAYKQTIRKFKHSLQKESYRKAKNEAVHRFKHPETFLHFEQLLHPSVGFFTDRLDLSQQSFPSQFSDVELWQHLFFETNISI